MNPFMKALIDHYNAQISEALATLSLYLNTSVGIGEHSDILAELKKYISILDDADGKLSTIHKYMIVNQTNKEEPKPNV